MGRAPLGNHKTALQTAYSVGLLKISSFSLFRRWNRWMFHRLKWDTCVNWCTMSNFWLGNYPEVILAVKHMPAREFSSNCSRLERKNKIYKIWKFKNLKGKRFKSEHVSGYVLINSSLMHRKLIQVEIALWAVFFMKSMWSCASKNEAHTAKTPVFRLQILESKLQTSGLEFWPHKLQFIFLKFKA